MAQTDDRLAPLIRMNGLGNEILVADMRGRADRVTATAALALGTDPDTRFDQIMAVHDPRSAATDHYIEILNADGSMAETCGNGMRCVVQMLAGHTGRQRFILESLAGILEAIDHGDGRISVDMGEPRFAWHEIPLAREISDTRAIDLQVPDMPSLQSPAAVSMGNPHVIFWVMEEVWTYGLEDFGPQLETHSLFPERANISIAQVADAGHITLRTWERGAGLTKACGSAACAAAVSAARTGRTGRNVAVTLPGGVLEIEWRDDNRVIMTGPAETEFHGRFDPATGRWMRLPTEGAA